MIDMKLPRLSLLLSLVLLASLFGCSTKPKNEEPQADNDNGLAYRVISDLPVVDGENKLIEKYDYRPEAQRVSDSVPSSTKATGSTEETYIPPPDRWVFIRTSKGNVRILVHSSWSPNGARRFIQLVEEKFYDGAPWFRVNDNIAQTGIAPDPETNTLHIAESVKRDPMHGSNTRGMVSFAQNNPDGRNTQFFVNLTDNPNLDGPDNYFVPFAEVMEGMDVLDELFRTGDPKPGLIEQIGSEGVMAFKRQYPQGDVIEMAALEN